jgi:cytochrome c-type biogenesis protein CcmH/NrfG
VGLIRALVGAPTAPLRGVLAVAEQVRQQAEDQFYDPAAIRRQIEQVDRLRAEGALSEEEAVAWEDELVERLLVSRDRQRRE